MKNKLLLILMIFSFLNTGRSQVFVSKVMEQEILLGPKSISANTGNLALSYISKISDFKKEMQEKKNLYSEQIQNFQEKERLKKKELRVLRHSEQELELIDKELGLIEVIRESWHKELNEQDQLLELRELIEAGECIEMVTNEGVFFKEEVEIEIVENEESFDYFETIPVVYAVPKTEWVKKKADRNCLSPDPNDCLVWCLVEKPEAYYFKDMEGVEHDFGACPVDFQFREKEQECVLGKVFNEEQKSLQIVRLKRKGENKVLVLKTWKMIKC